MPRLSSVIRKSGVSSKGADLAKLGTDLERGVMCCLLEYPANIDKATRENEPSIIAEYLLDLCAVFNRMYADKQNHQIITDDEGLTKARVMLVEAVRNTLASGLGLLGLVAPEKM